MLLEDSEAEEEEALYLTPCGTRSPQEQPFKHLPVPLSPSLHLYTSSAKSLFSFLFCNSQPQLQETSPPFPSNLVPVCRPLLPVTQELHRSLVPALGTGLMDNHLLSMRSSSDPSLVFTWGKRGETLPRKKADISLRVTTISMQYGQGCSVDESRR